MEWSDLAGWARERPSSVPHRRGTPMLHVHPRFHSIPTANARRALCSLLKRVRRRGRWHHRRLLPVLLHYKEVLLGIISTQGFIFFQPLMLAGHSVLCRRDLEGEVGDILEFFAIVFPSHRGTPGHYLYPRVHLIPTANVHRTLDSWLSVISLLFLLRWMDALLGVKLWSCQSSVSHQYRWYWYNSISGTHIQVLDWDTYPYIIISKNLIKI